MPYLATAQEWLTQSNLLIKARPHTTRITSKYNIAHSPLSKHAPSSKRSQSTHKPRLPKKPKSENENEATTSSTAAATVPEPPRATFVLKTYCPVSGVTLKYSTNKAAEVGRLIQILGRLGRVMAGLPEQEDVVMGEGEAVVGTPVKEESAPAVVGAKVVGGQAQGQAQPGQSGKGKKKKGKK